MPVLATIATINLLFGSTDDEKVSLLNPDLLRERCEDVLLDAEVRDQAINLSEYLQQLARDYNTAVLATVEAYRHELEQPDSSATRLIEIIETMDDSRRAALTGIVRTRESFRELLTREDWERVFS